MTDGEAVRNVAPRKTVGYRDFERLKDRMPSKDVEFRYRTQVMISGDLATAIDLNSGLPRTVAELCPRSVSRQVQMGLTYAYSWVPGASDR